MSIARLTPLVAGLLLLFLQGKADAKPHFVLQSGANHGLIAVGYADHYGKLHWALSYGLTPSEADETVITQGNGKVNVTVAESQSYRVLTGFSVLVNASGRTFFRLPEKYPDGYYPPNAVFSALQLTVEGHDGYFVEASLLDYYVEVLAKNPRGSVSTGEVVSLGIGRHF